MKNVRCCFIVRTGKSETGEKPVRTRHCERIHRSCVSTESEVVLDIHWETGKEILCKIYKSGNLPIVGTGNRNSRSRVIDCAEIYKEQEIFCYCR